MASLAMKASAAVFLGLTQNASAYKISPRQSHAERSSLLGGFIFTMFVVGVIILTLLLSFVCLRKKKRQSAGAASHPASSGPASCTGDETGAATSSNGTYKKPYVAVPYNNVKVAGLPQGPII